ncbi:hypothetical protein [Nocardioides speluncae]|uniref:hypothetical protein n=1 Tax=Nocardioides speluncae TaxID=2670337 RepID=UPI000D68B39C|nr:hypothetical protein [Nocardioides speluncae]
MTELTSQEPEQQDEPPAEEVSNDEISYEEFGVAFFREAVTPERILGAIHGLAAEPIEFGPMGVGPGRIARVSAKGQIGEPLTTQVSEQPVSFQVNLPVALAFTLDLLVDTHRFDADVMVPLTITAHARNPLTIYIDVTPPRSRDLNVVVKGDSVRAELMRKVADIDSELRRFISKYISRELDKPAVRALRTIDIAAIMLKAWPGEGPPQSPPASPEH